MEKDIKHVWFDLDGTLTVQTPEFHKVHDDLRYDTFAEATGKTRSEKLEQEYEDLYKKHGSNSAVFRSLGLPSDYWSLRAQTMDPDSFYEPVPAVYETLNKLMAIVPVSLFTNSKPGSVSEKLKVINIDEGWFTYIINGDDVQERKPALDGFKLMVQKSGLPAVSLLFVGDRVDVDIKPAKAVGMQTCLVWSSSEEADYSFIDFRDLLSLLAPKH
jgi:putative hydrolase of the HAD superfamily